MAGWVGGLCGQHKLLGQDALLVRPISAVSWRDECCQWAQRLAVLVLEAQPGVGHHPQERAHSK